MATRTVTELPEHMLDEIWTIMHMVAELGAHPETTQFSETKWYFECEGDVNIEDLDVDSPTERNEKEKQLIDIAERLRRLGDTYYPEQEGLVPEVEFMRDDTKVSEQERLEQEIVDYIRARGREIEEYIGAKSGDNKGVTKLRPSDVIFQSGGMSILYSYFRSRLENFLGEGEGLSKIAIVSCITQGVAGGLRESSSVSVSLVTCLATKFITDKYGDFLMRNGGMAKLVLDTPIN